MVPGVGRQARPPWEAWAPTSGVRPFTPLPFSASDRGRASPEELPPCLFAACWDEPVASGFFSLGSRLLLWTAGAEGSRVDGGRH